MRLLLVGAALSAGCAPIAATGPHLLPAGGALQAEPRGIVGEPCPPALAAKAYC